MISKILLSSLCLLVVVVEFPDLSSTSFVRQKRENNCNIQQIETKTDQIFDEIREIKLEVISSLGFRGYVYYISPNFMNWEDARVYCQSAGGDLAQYGIRIMKNKEEIAEAIIEPLYPRSRVWIGLRKIDDQWTWNDGTNATDAEIMWDYNQPDLTGDCGNFFDHRSDYRTDDDDCSVSDLFRALCERVKPSFGPDF